MKTKTAQMDEFFEAARQLKLAWEEISESDQNILRQSFSPELYWALLKFLYGTEKDND